MRQGFVKTAAVTPKMKVADTIYNAQQICVGMDEAFLRELRFWCFRSFVFAVIPVRIFFGRNVFLRPAGSSLASLQSIPEERTDWFL